MGVGDSRPAPETPEQRIRPIADTGRTTGAAGDSVPTWTTMHNVEFRFTESIALDIEELFGQMVSLREEGPVYFARPRKLLLKIYAAKVSATPENLANLMNDYVFNYPGAPLSDLTLTLEGDRITMSGTLHKAIAAPFSLTATVSATPEGQILLQPTDVEVVNIPTQPLMDVLALSLEELIDVSKAPGVKLQGNEMILLPERLLPPPPIEGTVTDAAVTSDALALTFSTPEVQRPPDSVLVPPDTTADNYMFFRGDTLRFGKLFMIESDLQIVDADPDDPFEFFLRKYKPQLVAGYSRVMPDFGLKVVMPDYSEVGPTVEEDEKLPE